MPGAWLTGKSRIHSTFGGCMQCAKRQGVASFRIKSNGARYAHLIDGKRGEEAISTHEIGGKEWRL